MANTDGRLVVTGLDFQDIKNNFKKFLSTQTEFKDYNFEASGLTILIDLLAYNTHYNSYYLNMIANEMFLDSAIMRSSAVSQAKLLGYTPRSVSSSMAVANLVITATHSQYPYGYLTLPRFTRFLSETVSGQNFIFVNTEQTTVKLNSANGTFDFNELMLYEGTPQTQIYNYDSVTYPNQEFILPDINIDTSSIQVYVQTSSQKTNRNVFTMAIDATSVANTDNVFYLDEYNGGQYKIYFGDGVIGTSLSNGNIVIVTYLTASASAPNGASKFTLMDTIIPGSTSSIDTLFSASGGNSIESVSSIKFSAPKNFAAQNRAVTTDDYITLLNSKYPYFDAISVWGGEQQSPPIYGKVFVSVKPKNGYQVTEVEKQYIVNELIKPFNVVTVIPEIVDPDYTFFNFTSNVYYNPKIITSSLGDLETGVRNAIIGYCNKNLNTFNASFLYSRLLRNIDDIDPAITSNEIEFFLEKRFTPTLGISQTITLKFYNELQRFSGVPNTGIYSNPYFQVYDSVGVIRDASIEEIPQSFSGIDSIAVTDGGSGYITEPVVTIQGDGSGATAVATIVNGSVVKVTVTNPGTEYTSAQIYLTGVSTTQAKAIVKITARYGKLRTYYFDENRNKILLDNNAGTVDYNLGVVTLTNFQPLSVSSLDNVIHLHARPVNLAVNSSLNSILSLDQFDPGAISIILNATS
jgi:hypothetical protein